MNLHIPGLALPASRQAAAWQLRRLATANAALLAAGIALAAAAVGAYWLEVEPLRDRTETLQGDLAAAQIAVTTHDEKPAPAAQLATYYALFPPAAGRAQVLARFFEIGGRQKVQLAQGDYSLRSSPGERLQRYDVTFPIKGSYAQIRAFALQASRDIPNAGLESISFQRKAASEATVQAQIKFAVHLQAGGSR